MQPMPTRSPTAKSVTSGPTSAISYPGVRGFSRALDPYETDVGRLRSGERLPDRVRPRRLG
ncbi:MAG: hypothetical protein ACRDPE_07040 [Solirubrobacterales bacterium]